MVAKSISVSLLLYSGFGLVFFCANSGEAAELFATVGYNFSLRGDRSLLKSLLSLAMII